ncbi:hypothetical protein JCM11491_000103 [Sporobolomyces phaffii]
MLRSIRPVSGARTWLRYHSTTASRSATVLPTASASAHPATPSPPPATAERIPQPFIPRPLERELQLESVSTTGHDPTRSTTLHFVDPSTPSHAVSLAVPNLWLRDCSIHPDHVHPASHQKLFRTTDVPRDGKLVGYGVHDVPGHGPCLVTEWSTPLATPGVDPKAVKLSVVPVKSLAALVRGGRTRAAHDGHLPPARTWDREQLARSLVRIDYRDFATSDRHRFEMLDGLVRDGIVLLRNVPTDSKAGHDTELRRVVERIGSLRRTWYGDLWDVKAEQGSRNIAYTNLDLGLHMDLTHFDHPPRYQFLHSLVNSHVVGGESYFVDAYALADELRVTQPAQFHTLATEPVQFEYRNGPHWTRFQRPTFELVAGSTHSLHAVNYSPPFQGALPLERVNRARGPSGAAVVTSDDTDRLLELHDALGAFARLCDDADNRWRFRHQLEPGECVVFDNRRVLHARTAFEFMTPSAAAADAAAGEKVEGETTGRWLKGAYMDGDEVWSRWRVEKDNLASSDDAKKKKGRTLFV